MNPTSNTFSHTNAQSRFTLTNNTQNNLGQRRDDQSIQSPQKQMPQSNFSNQRVSPLRPALQVQTTQLKSSLPTSPSNSVTNQSSSVGNSKYVKAPNVASNQFNLNSAQNQTLTNNPANPLNDIDMQDPSSEKYSVLNSQIAFIRQEMQRLQEGYEREISSKTSEVAMLRDHLKSATEDIANMKQLLFEREKKEEEYRREFDKLKYQVATQEHEFLEKQVEKVTVSSSLHPNNPNASPSSTKTKTFKLPHTSLGSPNNVSPLKHMQDPISHKKRDHSNSLADDSTSLMKKQKIEKEIEVLRTNNSLLKQRLLEVKRALNGESEYTGNPQDPDQSGGLSLRDDILEILKQEIKEVKNALGNQVISSPEDTSKFKEQIASLQKLLETEKLKSTALERQVAVLSNEKREEIERNKALSKEIEEQRSSVLTLFNKNVQVEQELEKMNSISSLLKEKEEQLKKLEEKQKSMENSQAELQKQISVLANEKQQAEQTIVLLLHHVQTLGIELPFDISTQTPRSGSNQNPDFSTQRSQLKHISPENVPHKATQASQDFAQM